MGWRGGLEPSWDDLLVLGGVALVLLDYLGKVDLELLAAHLTEELQVLGFIVGVYSRLDGQLLDLKDVVAGIESHVGVDGVAEHFREQMLDGPLVKFKYGPFLRDLACIKVVEEILVQRLLIGVPQDVLADGVFALGVDVEELLPLDYEL